MVMQCTEVRHPMLTPCFTDQNTTVICPLDIAYNQPLKARLKAICARSLAYNVLQKVLGEGPGKHITINVDTALSCLKGRMCEWLSKSLHQVANLEDVQAQEWRHLLVQECESDLVHNEARRRHPEIFGPASQAAGASGPTEHDDTGIEDFAPDIGGPHMRRRTRSCPWRLEMVQGAVRLMLRMLQEKPLQMHQQAQQKSLHSQAAGSSRTCACSAPGLLSKPPV